jgi:unsaturated chondroitin disaccharide hydrolase
MQMSVTRPTLALRAIAMVATLVTVLMIGLSMHAQSASAATSGPSAFKTEARLLLQRVDEIAAQTGVGKFPLGTGTDGVLRFAEGWTSGFWGGTLWRAADLRNRAAATEAAREATIDHLGFEQTKTHDLGFMYGETSVAAYERLCKPTSTSMSCREFRTSGMLASYTLTGMARTTGQGIIPLGSRTCSDCEPGGAETIIDSMMNLPLLYWATKTTGNRKYRNLALKHARWVAANLVRKDGSTFQAASYPRKAKKPKLVKHTHQGLRNSSTWSRGQAWSIYGFADAGMEFRSKAFLGVAERNANYVAERQNGQAPPWDYNAPIPAPRDVSAGVIMAAGFFHLAAACKAVKGACAQTERWDLLGRTMLSGSLANISRTAPIGYLGNQVYTLGGRDTWDDDAELIFGLDYALEAIKLSRARQ